LRRENRVSGQEEDDELWSFGSDDDADELMPFGGFF